MRGNYIGTDITGTLDRHNNGPGVTIPQGSDNIVSGNDADRTAPNVIMFNTGPGIHVGDASTRNKLRINRIDLNRDLGIISAHWASCRTIRETVMLAQTTGRITQS